MSRVPPERVGFSRRRDVKILLPLACLLGSLSLVMGAPSWALIYL
jgi:hypothetical protein